MFNAIRGFMIYGTGEILARLITFLGFLFLARTLSKSDYGLLESYVVTIGLISVVGSVGLNNALQAFYYSKEDYPEVSESQRLSTAFYTLLIWQMIIVVPLAILIATLYKLTPSMELAFLLANIAALSTQLQLMQDVFRLRFQAFKYLVSTILSKGGTAVFSVTMILMGAGIKGYLWGYFLALIASFILLLYFLWEDLTLKLHLSLARSMLRYGFPFILVGTGIWAFTSLDRWLLASFLDFNAVGDYGFAVRISFLVSFLSLAFGQAWSPMVFKLKESRPTDYLAIYADSFLSFVLVIALLASAISIFSPEVQCLLFHDKYKDALPAILILCFTAVIQATTNFTGIGISLSRKTRYFAMFTWLAAGISLLGNSILIPYWGINAAAAMNFFSNSILSIMYFIKSQKEYRMLFEKKNIIWFALLISYLFIGSIIFVLKSVPFDSFILKISFLLMAIIGLVIYLKMMVLRYGR